MSSKAVPKGFRFAGCHAGIKPAADREDMTLVWTDGPSVAAGVYTTNRIVAAPVEIDRRRTPMDGARAVIVNSGNANACTGDRGREDAQTMIRWTAERCQVEPESVLVMSTGIIGQRLSMERIQSGIDRLAQEAGETFAHCQAAARGILTTDTRIKLQSRSLELGGAPVTLLGMAKGAGMIGPRMATLLGILTTDLALTPAAAQSLLVEAVEASFNCVRVEGHMSTNDTVLLLASGASGQGLTEQNEAQVRGGLRELCIELARSIADDGEGASHLISIRVTGAASVEDARQVARTIADSPLVKTAVAGADPNWGRIVSAAGYAGVPLDPQRLALQLNGFLLFQQGQPAPFDADQVRQSIAGNRETLVALDLGQGECQGECWTCDLTAEYVHINADYST